MGWLRFAPYPFAVASLVLNVYSSFGKLPAMLGHAVVTVSFFLPLLAAEAAVKSMSVSDEVVARRAEQAGARRYAMDLMRAQKGIFWRWRPSVPSLLRIRIRQGRFPAHIATAIREGASFGGAAKWESLVEAMVADALTQGVKMSVSVQRQERDIKRQALATEDATEDATAERQGDRQSARQPKRQPKRQATASERARARDKAVRIVKADAAIAAAELADKCGVSKRTAERWKGEMVRPGLSAVK
jgi:hypothetical protein